MRRLWGAWILILAASSSATAQHLTAPASLTRVDATPAATIAVESPRQPRAMDDPRTALTPGTPGDSHAGDPATAGSQILERLPIDRLQRLLKKNVALRVAEAAVGATIVGYQLRRAGADSTIGQLGVHAIRFGGAEWLERSRFRVEPQIVRGGFVVYVKKNN
jgi:hypothetical protein